MIGSSININNPSLGVFGDSDLLAGLNREWELGTDYSNIVSSPSSGAAQSDYDGSPSAMGAISGGAFSFTASNSQIDQFSSATAFMNSLHKTTGGVSWTSYQVISTGGGNSDYFLQTKGTGQGIRCRINGSRFLQIYQEGAAQITITGSSLIPASTFTPVIITYDHTSDTMKIKIGSNAIQTISPANFSTSSTDAERFSKIQLNTGGLMKGVGFLAQYCDDTDIGTVYDYLAAL